MQHNNAASRQAFSLIELMVVIAIIGILAAVATPSYRDYVIRSKIVEGVTLINGMMQALHVEYETKGAYPSTLLYNGGSYASTAMVAASLGNINAVHYTNNTTTAYICLQFVDIGIPSQVASTGTNWGSYSGICSHSRVNNGVHESFCGMWAPTDTRFVPSQYLPAGCNCTNVSVPASPACP